MQTGSPKRLALRHGSWKFLPGPAKPALYNLADDEPKIVALMTAKLVEISGQPAAIIRSPACTVRGANPATSAWPGCQE